TEGTKVRIGQTIATIDPDGKPSAKPAASGGAKKAEPAAIAAPASAKNSEGAKTEEELSPAVRRMVEEHQLGTSKIAATGPGGRITKEDVVKHMESRNEAEPPAAIERPERAADLDFASATPIVEQAAPVTRADGAGQRRVAMSKIRKKIAERLVSAQHTAAIL